MPHKLYFHFSLRMAGPRPWWQSRVLHLYLLFPVAVTLFIIIIKDPPLPQVGNILLWFRVGSVCKLCFRLFRSHDYFVRDGELSFSMSQPHDDTHKLWPSMKAAVHVKGWLAAY